MIIRRTAIAAAVTALLSLAVIPQSADAQGYGGHHGGRLPLMRARSWSESEDGGWSGVWTFTGPNTMSAYWTNNQTGRHRRANNMNVSVRGQQIVISRPGLGNYVGTISNDGRSLEGTLSWSSGRFRASAQ